MPGTATAPYPTIENISLLWPYGGDANGDSRVSVRFRRVGDAAWTTGMPLRRLPAGSTSQGFSWTARHAGSLFNLQPATAYQVELTLSDADGGGATQTLGVTTRAVPAPAASPTVKAVNLANAATVFAAANPGDILDLAAGTYSGFTFARDGTATAPIVIRSNAGAVVNGEIALYSRAYVHITGLTVNGRIRFNGSRHIAIVRNTINASATQLDGDGIVGYERPENCYIADNTIVGTTVWAESSLGADGGNRGEGILVSGPGHVIQNNRVTGFRDNISLYESADNAETQAMEQLSIDILNNDLAQAADDAIEADFCLHNCRIMRNRITNAFVALSSQPGIGGPTYFMRNVLYNVVHVPFKLYRNSHGDVLMHNTVVKNGDAFGAYPGMPIAYLFGRNNLFIGGPGGTYNGYSSGSGRVLQLQDLQLATADLDYDGYGATTGSFDGRFAAASFATLSQLQGSGIEPHARQVGLGVFQASIAFPGSPLSTYAAPDLRLKAGGTPVDGGQAIPNVNDGYAGSAPDLGAYELGSTLPVYGPR